MTVYVLNAPILTDYGEWRFSGPLPVDEANRLLQSGFVSAVGHRATADLLSRLLGLEVQASRRRIRMAVGDRAIVFRVLRRLPEGRVLDDEDLTAIPYELSLLTRLS